ncbi:hypothetical protein [Methylomagnum ishizawai]|uniref:hypothetical protein n=1 Tax=Methylomagnum ishizawai TaxID=1760988 RepID=UPI001C7F01DC
MSSKKTAGLVQEITSASEEQATGAKQIAEAMNQLSKTIQQNASASEELSATAEEMSGQALELRQTLSFFKISANATDLTTPRYAIKTRTYPPQAHTSNSTDRGGHEQGFSRF